ncbi:MAG: MopE-related protein, partial [Myxococcota bacterium]
KKDDPPGLFEDKDGDDDGYLWDEDCNDANAAIHPGAQEVCDPADVDEDCDGLADAADDSTSGTITAWHDADSDGFGNPDEPTPVCEVVAGYVVDATDCDDAAPTVNPAAVEVCDELVDNDCDGLYDNGDDSIDDTTRIDVWEDADGDSYGDPATATRACFVATGYADRPEDCDDADALTNPASYETCGGADEDCDGTIDEDEAVDAPTWHDDGDGDGYGDADDTAVACDAPTRHVADGTDCDDTSRSNRPGATEYCDEEDNDCDGTTDEDDAVDASTWYADADADRYGDPDTSRDACDQPTGYVADASDCDDASASVRPGATEVCDSADTDEDCDGAADDADTSVSSTGKRTFYADTDGDGYGRSTGTQRCDGGTGWASTSTDCDDASASINPAGTEVCDASNADEDCDGRADDNDTSVSAATKTTWYPDTDGDGYGVAGTTRSQ